MDAERHQRRFDRLDYIGDSHGPGRCQQLARGWAMYFEIRARAILPLAAD
jgi:hypothetical protein